MAITEETQEKVTKLLEACSAAHLKLLEDGVAIYGLHIDDVVNVIAMDLACLLEGFKLAHAAVDGGTYGNSGTSTSTIN